MFGSKIAFSKSENVKVKEWWVNLVKFNLCYFCEKPCFEMVNLRKILKNFYPSLFMDRSEFNNDDLNDI